MRLLWLIAAAALAGEPRACLEAKFRRGTLAKERIEIVAATPGVTLKGTVRNPSRKAAATRAARACGFDPVRNELSIAPDPAPRRTAKLIQQR